MIINWLLLWEVWWTLSLRGRRSRNKVSVGEPAEGSFAQTHSIRCICIHIRCYRVCNALWLHQCVLVFDMQCECLSWVTQVCCCSLYNVGEMVMLIMLNIFSFQWWMSWPMQRWRVQWIVINFVNCRFPGINRALNVRCALGWSEMHFCVGVLTMDLHIHTTVSSLRGQYYCICACVRAMHALSTWTNTKPCWQATCICDMLWVAIIL